MVQLVAWVSGLETPDTQAIQLAALLNETTSTIHLIRVPEESTQTKVSLLFNH